VAVIVVLIGVIALPTVGATDVTDTETARGVVKVADEEEDPVPALFVAALVTVYVVPGASPVAEILVDEVSVVITTAAPPPLGVKVMTYPVMAAPPLFVGAVREIAALVAVDAVVLTIVGVFGAIAGVLTDEENVPAAPLPTPFVATAEIT
jgi:hypothetical protein